MGVLESRTWDHADLVCDADRILAFDGYEWKPVGADRTSSSSDRCPDGVEVRNFWVGEYPEPVIHVSRTVTVAARVTPCDRDPTRTCTVSSGVYHPWSRGPARFATIGAIERFRVLRATTVGEISVVAGEVVEVPGYLSEGMCEWRIRGETVSESCPDQLADSTGRLFEAVPTVTPGFSDTQLLGLSCTDGSEAWIDVRALSTVPGVRQGKVLGYGEVGP